MSPTDTQFDTLVALWEARVATHGADDAAAVVFSEILFAHARDPSGMARQERRAAVQHAVRCSGFQQVVRAAAIEPVVLRYLLRDDALIPKELFDQVIAAQPRGRGPRLRQRARWYLTWTCQDQGAWMFFVVMPLVFLGFGLSIVGGLTGYGAWTENLSLVGLGAGYGAWYALAGIRARLLTRLLAES